MIGRADRELAAFVGPRARLREAAAAPTFEPGSDGSVASGRAILTTLGLGAAFLAASTAGMLRGTEPFATWYYVLAWYPTLLMLEAAVAWRGGRFLFFGHATFFLSLAAWSVPLWLLFELINFRLENWYYVFVPDHRLARWAGIALSFATVLPAIFGAERALGAWGVGRRRTRAIKISPARLVAIQVTGIVALVLPLLWPRLFFPLVWVGVTLIVDPWVYRRDPRRSLLGDLERGGPGRIVRLLIGGMAIGLLWELFNVRARGKWIYTVPGLEELKLFEMPLLGFFGFPVFALEAFSAYQALVVAGVAVDPRRRSRSGGVAGDRRPRDIRGASLAALFGAIFSVLVLRGMELETISSTSPSLAAIPDAPVEGLRRAGYDVFDLARAEPGQIAALSGARTSQTEAWIQAARLVTLRGIGTENAARLRALGIAALPDLAASDPERLAGRLARAGLPIPPARVHVWVRAARMD